MEFPQEKQDYINRFTTKSHEDAASIVHKLKHKLNICGMQDAYRLAVRYEEELKQSATNSHREFLRVLEQVDEFIKQL